MDDSRKDEFNEEDPKLCRRLLSRFPLASAFWKRGLVAVGEYEAEARRLAGLPLVGSGEVFRLEGLPARDPDASRYLGGVAYCVPGVAGGVELGSRPRRERWVGVNGISDRSSFGRNSGYSAVRMFIINNKRNMTSTISAFAAMPKTVERLCVLDKVNNACSAKRGVWV